MKLKRVTKSRNDDWQKCCRYCHNYFNGKCYNKSLDVVETLSVYKVAEEGYLDATLEETLGSVSLDNFKELEYLLRQFKLSEKRIGELNDLFKKCWEEFVENTLKPELEENVAMCYQNQDHENTFDGITILEPESYCCKDWC